MCCTGLTVSFFVANPYHLIGFCLSIGGLLCAKIFSITFLTSPCGRLEGFRRIPLPSLYDCNCRDELSVLLSRPLLFVLRKTLCQLRRYLYSVLLESNNVRLKRSDLAGPVVSWLGSLPCFFGWFFCLRAVSNRDINKDLMAWTVLMFN